MEDSNVFLNFASVKTPESAKTFYTLDGVQNDKPQKGINIIRTNEGKTKKVLVK